MLMWSTATRRRSIGTVMLIGESGAEKPRAWTYWDDAGDWPALLLFFFFEKKPILLFELYE